MTVTLQFRDSCPAAASSWKTRRCVALPQWWN